MEHTVLGIMSGSSLDGIDFAVCRFSFDADAEEPVQNWSILAATTAPYPTVWRERLRSAPHLPAFELQRLDVDLAKWIAYAAQKFLDQYPEYEIELVGCHGHTVFHAPEHGFSVQLGKGEVIATHLGLPTVTELRNADMAAGGQGAPIAPVADRHLYPDYSAFLNLGGIANFSYGRPDGSIIAGDVSGCCQILDRLAAEDGLPYDAGGAMAASGQYLPELAARLDALAYHAEPYPKSLANAWVVNELWPILRNHHAPVADRLHTFCRWLAETIAEDLALSGGVAGTVAAQSIKVLVTGGGARNDFLLTQLNATQADNGPFNFVVGGDDDCDFKEAALIALCALLRQYGLPNSLASATGATHDTVNGALFSGAEGLHASRSASDQSHEIKNREPEILRSQSRIENRIS